MQRNGRVRRKTTPGTQARGEVLRATPDLGRTLWRNWSGYYPRSRVNSKMRGLKRLGERLMARTYDQQTAQLQI